jgi:vitamin-K-epoxide reductase (warfarin-sensitive)
MASKTMRLVGILSILGMLLSGYLGYLHFSPTHLESSFCNLDDYYSCSTVNQSSYSTLFGIPVAFLGIIGFALLGYLSLERLSYARVGLFYGAGGALGFMLYLLWAELFVIKAVCILCVATLLTVVAIFGLVAWTSGKESVQFVREIKFE